MLGRIVIRSVRKGRAYFCSQQDKGWKVTNAIKKAWKMTFPSEQDEIREKHSAVKSAKHYTREEIEEMQQQIPQQYRTSLTTTEQQPQKDENSFKLKDAIPENLRNKIASSDTYKEYSQFKQNLKEYISTRDGVVSNATSYVYNVVTQDSILSKATELMRKYDPSFNIHSIQKEAHLIFLEAFNRFLKNDIQYVQKIASGQALSFFQSHINLLTTQKLVRKYNNLLHSYPTTLYTAQIGEKTLPTFVFYVQVVQAHCLLDPNGKIVDGDQDRIHDCTYQFSLCYAGNHLAQLGHPWEIVSIKKLNQTKLLV